MTNIALSNTAFVIFTNSSYQDIFDMSINRHERFSHVFEKIILSDKIMNPNYKHILYDNTLSYPDRLKYLEQLPESIEYIILSHEWAILYDYVNIQK